MIICRAHPAKTREIKRYSVAKSTSLATALSSSTFFKHHFIYSLPLQMKNTATYVAYSTIRLLTLFTVQQQLLTLLTIFTPILLDTTITYQLLLSTTATTFIVL